MKTWMLGISAGLLAAIAVINAADAAELDFPEKCVELQGVSHQGLFGWTASSRDSVLFAFDNSNSRNRDKPLSFIAWNTKTGKRLGTFPVFHPAANWLSFSPDGTHLAVGVFTNVEVVELWEVGSKDMKGMPQLRLIANLRQRKSQQNEFGFGVGHAWTPDSKTLITNVGIEQPGRRPVREQILFWSLTDKPSVWSDPKEIRPCCQPLEWKPWAKLEFETRMSFAVSPDNRTFAVHPWTGPDCEDGQLFDLATVQPQEKFRVDRGARKYKGACHMTFSADSKTLAISSGQSKGYFSLWDTVTLTPRIEIGEVDQNFLSGAEQEGGERGATFTRDNRWILGGRSAGKYTGGRLQFRDVERGELCSEVRFPPSLGSLYEFPVLPDGRVMTKFVARKRSGEFDTRYFLWHVEDLLSYGSKH